MPSIPPKPKLESSSDFENRIKMFNGEESFDVPMIRYVQVQTHSRCNAGCVFCPYSESWHAKNSGKMTDDLWKKVLENLKPFAKGINKGKFLPYLMQEPLIDPSIFKKIKDIYSCFPTTCVELSTNGASLTKRNVEELIELFSDSSHKHQIWVSHHGIDQQSYEKIMKMNYQKAFDQLIYFMKKSEGRLRIRVRGMGERRDGEKIFFSKEQYNEYWQNNLEKHNISPKNIQIDAHSFHDRANTLTHAKHGSPDLNMGQLRKIDRENRFYCPRIDLWIHILWNGELRLCCMDYHGEVKLPSLNEMNLKEYFQSQEFQEVYHQVTGLKNSDEQFICKRCTSPGG